MAANPDTTDRKVVHVPKEMASAISRHRFGREIGSEAEAIRQLIGKGLEAYRKEAEERTEGGAPA